MEKIQPQFQVKEKQIHLYASEEQFALRKIANSRTLQQILLEKITSDDQISQIYSCINERVQSYKTNSVKPSINMPNEIINYLSIKAKLFYNFYSTSSKDMGIKNILNIFEIDNLYELFVDIHHIRDQVKDSIYKLYGLQKRETKINGCLLIFKIQSLLKQIVNAAFPYLLYTRTDNIINISSQTIVLSEFESILLEKQLKKLRKFKIQELSPLKNSLLQLNDEIQTMKIAIAKEQEALAKVDIRQSLLIRNQIDAVEKVIKISQLEFTKFNHQVYAYIEGFIHKIVLNTPQSCNKFIEESPIFQANIQKLEEYANENKEGVINLGSYYKYLKLLIDNIHHIYQKDHKKALSTKCLQNLLNLLQRQLKFSKYSQKNELLYENYISALRIQRQIDPSYLSQNEANISTILSKYLQNIMNHYINNHWTVIYQIISFEEQFTYSLLTTNKIVQTLIQYQDKFTQLIHKFTPQLQILIQISKIHLKNIDKKVFIQEVLSRMYYPSLKEEGCIKLLQGSKLKQKSDVYFNIDVILTIQHESIQQIYPYMRQIKHILMLVSILKRSQIKRNVNKMQQEQYSNLKKIASYFSKERCSCVIYELKSKILLFITLFKMGYHNPTIRQEQKLVNLRNRIINLYNKLYSHNASSMLLSRINSISTKKSYSQESYIIYDPQSADLKASVSDSVLKYQSESLQVQIQASQQLVTKINNFIMTNFASKENNSKSYLTNLLNILQHQLFIFEKNINQENQSQLSRDYTDHLRVCMGLDQNQLNSNIQIILNIERLFYLGEYEKAWDILTKQKLSNSQFNIFLQKLESSSSTNNEILKFLRLYNLFDKMNHMLFTDANKQENINELTQMANANSQFLISKNAIEIIYGIKMRQNRLIQLQKFYLSRLNSKQSINDQYKQSQSFLTKRTKGEIKVFKLQKINKTVLKIQISNFYVQHFAEISQEFKKFYLFNQIGIFKLNQLKIDKVMQIQIQSNPYILEDQQNLFQSKILEFKENLQQKFCRKVLQFIIQVLHLFYDQSLNSLQSQQITLDTQPYSFCINPFYGIIGKIIKNKYKKKNTNSFAISIKNRQTIEKLIEPFLPHFSPCFKQHYFYFLESFTNFSLKKPNISMNKLLQLPFFMTLQQKQVFLVYFDNKMSDMCDNFHEQQRKLRKQKKYQQIQKLRLAKMKEQIYKNYSYHFIMGGVVQSEMKQLKICTQNQKNRLDWISEHKNLMISYDLPKKEGSQQIKQYAYSLNYFLKYLRGALAHKIENSYRIILNISEQFPMIFDYLHKNKHILQAKFDTIIEAKNNWLRDYFRLDEKSLNRLKLIFQGKYQHKIYINSDIQQSIAILKNHSQKYELKLMKSLTQQTYKCEKCNQFINLVKKSNNLFDLLQNITANLIKKQHFLILEHNFKDCFLSKHFKSHRIMQIFGLMKRVEPKHYIVLNWWFYIQTEMPCLIGSLEKMRYMLQQ